MRRQVRHAVRRGVRLKAIFFEAAAAAMAAAGLVPGSYGAIHNRQGDWSFSNFSMYLDPNTPSVFTEQPENRKFLERHGTIYVASNPSIFQALAMNAVWYPALQEKMAVPKRIVTFEGSAKEAAGRIVGHLPEWMGLVEMIICSHADTFLGSRASTFTGYIHRLRGYMPTTMDKRILFWEWANVREPARSFPSWSVANGAPEIAVLSEWPEGFSDEERTSFSA